MSAVKPKSGKIQVWAPKAQDVKIILEDGSSADLAPGERGQFTTKSAFSPGTKYRFLVDGRGPYPDPRSEYQPDGVHGISMRWSRDYPFTCTDFEPCPWERGVVYELHIGTFSEEGTFLGAIAHLDKLAKLGVTHIELMPLAAFPGKQGWGYDGVALFAPHAAYGTPDDLKKLVDEAHKRGLSVLLDVVFNHLGPDGNYLGVYGPYFTDRYGTPWGEAVNLDGPDSDLVRRFFVDCALYWLEVYQMDGLRLDAVHALFDKSAVHFLEELSLAVDALGNDSKGARRKRVLVAESDLNDPRYVRTPASGGFGLDAQWCDDFHHALHAFFSGERDGYYEDYGTLTALKKALVQGYVFDGNYSPHRRRRHGRPPDGVAKSQLVVFAQNHDQVGNRARGERLANLVGIAELHQIAALTLLSPFVPLLFQGEEWGTERPFLYFTDHQDIELARSVTEGRKREFSAFQSHQEDVPDPQAESTFLASRLAWEEREQERHSEILSWYQQLLSLRRDYSLFRADVPVEVEIDENKRWLVLRRGSLAAYLNFSAEAQSTIPGWQRAGDTVLGSYPAGISGTRGSLPARCVVIARQNDG